MNSKKTTNTKKKSSDADFKKAAEATKVTTAAKTVKPPQKGKAEAETAGKKSATAQALPVSAGKTVKKTTKQTPEPLAAKNAVTKETKEKEDTAMGKKSITTVTNTDAAKEKKSKKAEKAIEAPVIAVKAESVVAPAKITKKSKKAEKSVEAPVVVAKVEHVEAPAKAAKKSKKAEKIVEAPAEVKEEPVVAPAKAAKKSKKAEKIVEAPVEVKEEPVVAPAKAAKKSKKAEKSVEAPVVVAKVEHVEAPVKAAKKSKKAEKTAATKNNEVTDLNDAAMLLKKQIEELQMRLSELESKQPGTDTEKAMADAEAEKEVVPKKKKSSKKASSKSKKAEREEQAATETAEADTVAVVKEEKAEATEKQQGDTADVAETQTVEKKKKNSRKSKKQKTEDDVLAAVETTSIEDAPTEETAQATVASEEPVVAEEETAPVQKKKRGRKPKASIQEETEEYGEITDADLLLMMTQAKTSVADKKNAKALAKHAALTKNDTMKQYMGEIGVIPLVSKEQEIELASQIHGEDFEAQEAARNTLIMANLRLVVKIAHDFKGLGLPLLDLISEGNLGLMRAVMKFDPEKGAKFSSYAAWWIKQSMRRALANQSKTIRIPVQSAGKINKIKSSRVKLAEELGREPTDAEIASNLDYSERTVSGLRLADLRTFSLHDPIQQGEEGEFQDIIPDRSAMTPERILGDEESKNRLKQILGELDEREQQIIRMRFGIDYNDGQGMTLEEVSQRIGRTRERVRQIQNQALAKLRNKLADEASFNND